MIDTQSNRADYRRTYQLWDAEADEPVNTTLNPVEDIQMELEDPRTRNPKLIGSLKTGEITWEDPGEGIYSWAFLASEMQDIRDGRYMLGTIIISQGQTIQTLVEPVQIYRGIVGDG